MKSKRVFSLAILMLAVFCLFLVPNAVGSAGAAVVTTNKVVGHKYDLEYILEDAGVSKIDGQNTFAGGRTVKFKLESDSEFKDATSTIEFTSVGTYKFETYKTGETGVEYSFDVNVVKTEAITAQSLGYKFTPEQISSYNEKIQTVLTPEAGDGSALKVGDDFSAPLLEGLVYSEYFEFSDLSATVYYSTPQSESFSSASKKFELSLPGSYSYYVLFSDPANNKMSVEDLVLGNGGWYEKDADGNPKDDKVIVPIFTFNLEKTSAPKISVLTSEQGFLNLQYSIDCFTITAANYEAEYTLYYSENEYDKDSSEYATDTDYIKAVKSDSTLVDVTEALLDRSDLTFTPDKKGYYYVLVRAVDDANGSETAMSRAISVQKEYTKVVKEKTQTFIKENVISVVFLSISLVSFIAFIIVICIKPKEKSVELEVKSGK